jgi:hypothetical protein
MKTRQSDIENVWTLYFDGLISDVRFVEMLRVVNEKWDAKEREAKQAQPSL